MKGFPLSWKNANRISRENKPIPSSLGPKIAEGRTAEIFAWGNDQVIKLYRAGWDKGDAEYEYTKALASQASGFAVPAVGDLIEVNGRAGIVYQRLDGITLLQQIQTDKRKFLAAARQMAALHVEMHTKSGQDLPSQKETLKRKIKRADLEVGTTQAVLKHLAELPEGDKLCHGDFHPDNIFLSQSGTVIIDWVDAVRGHPMGDSARTHFLIAQSGAPPNTLLERVMQLSRMIFYRTYIRNYIRLSGVSLSELEAWKLPVYAGRLSEGIKEERPGILAFIRRKLGNI